VRDLPQGNKCTFAQDVQNRKDAAAAARALGDVTSLGIGGLNEATARAGVISGRIAQTGFDGRVRTWNAETGRQLQHLRGQGALGLAARGAGIAGGALSIYDVGAGYYRRDSQQFNDGSAGLVALGIGAVNPLAGLVAGASYFVGSLMRSGSGSSGPSVLSTMQNSCGPQ
jgi:hypothetical protein